jgi:hypothetical protein
MEERQADLPAAQAERTIQIYPLDLKDQNLLDLGHRQIPPIHETQVVTVSNRCQGISDGRSA